MIYELAHWLQSKFPYIWDSIEALNAEICGLKIGDEKKLRECLFADVRIADVNDACRLSEFFARQPEESYRWFRPHGFEHAAVGHPAGNQRQELFRGENVQGSPGQKNH